MTRMWCSDIRAWERSCDNSSTRMHGHQPPDKPWVPAGGGGLAAPSHCTASERSAARLFAVEPSGYHDLARSLAAGERHRNETPSRTLCDGSKRFHRGCALLRSAQTLSGALSVTDEDVRAGMRAALEHLKLVLEPSGASALAAALVAKQRGVDLGSVFAWFVRVAILRPRILPGW